MDCSYDSKYLDKSDYTVNVVTYEEKNGNCQNTGYTCYFFENIKISIVDSIGDGVIKKMIGVLFRKMN